jgi:iron complex outermembrane receptor protein
MRSSSLSDLGSRGSLTPVVELAWTGDYYRRPFNQPVDRVDAYTKTDARLVWASPSERWTVELYGQNLEDRDVFGRVIVLPEFLGGMPVGFEAFEPRTYGARVGFHWGSE